MTPSTPVMADGEQKRIGENPPASLVDLRSAAVQAVLSACGLPPPLGVAPGDGAAAREAWRRFLHGSIHPLSETVAEEAREELGVDVRLSFNRLFASDLAGRTRSFPSMVQGGMEPGKAAALAGLMEMEA